MVSLARVGHIVFLFEYGDAMISSGCRKLAKEWPAAGHGLLAEKLSTGRLVADCWPGLLRHMVFAPKLRFVSDDKLGPSF